VKAPAVFSAEEIVEPRDETDLLLRRTELIDIDNIRRRWQNHVETGACRFDCFDPVIDLSPAMERLARDSRITRRGLGSVWRTASTRFLSKARSI
jgi:hypothetical protein